MSLLARNQGKFRGREPGAKNCNAAKSRAATAMTSPAMEENPHAWDLPSRASSGTRRPFSRFNLLSIPREAFAALFQSEIFQHIQHFSG